MAAIRCLSLWMTMELNRRPSTEGSNQTLRICA